jgi:glycosyltransferase involved in cell wall biosynthesis
MSEKSPWLSVLVSSYNRPVLLEEAVISCVKAAIPEMEIIVSDDNSPDRNAVEERLRPYIKSGQISYFCEGQRQGMAVNWNRLVKAARGQFLMIIGDDDRIPPDALRRLKHWVEKHPEGDIYGFGYRIIDADGRRSFDYCCPRLMRYEIGRDCNWRELCYFDAVPMWSHHPFTMAVKRGVYDRLPYRTDVDCGGDVVFLWSALAQGFKFVVLPEVLFEWRVSAPKGDYSNRASRPERMKHSRALVLKAMLEMDGLPANMRACFRSREFLQRFLWVADSDVAEIKAAMSMGDGKVLQELVERLACGRQETLRNKLARHFRAIRVMGIGHVFQLWRYFQDKRQRSKSA